MAEIEVILGRRGAAWTASAVLPGGHLSTSRDDCAAAFAGRHAWLPNGTAYRLAYLYGSRASRVIGNATSVAEMGHHFGRGLYQREVDYLIEHEWARTAEDIISRRTKLRLKMTPDEIVSLEKYMRGREDHNLAVA